MLRFCPYKAGVGGSSPSTPTNRNPLVTGGFINSYRAFLLVDAPQQDALSLALDSPISRDIAQSCGQFVDTPTSRACFQASLYVANNDSNGGGRITLLSSSSARFAS